MPTSNPPDITQNFLHLACERCQAPNGARVLRLKADRIKWSLDHELAWRYPDIWTHPIKVTIFKATGLCASCASEMGSHPCLPGLNP